MDIHLAGSRPTRRAPTEYFTGTVLQDPIIQTEAPARLASTRVSFEPGARTAWHTHPLGQAVRAPGSKETRVEASRAGASVGMIGSCNTVPVKYLRRRAACRPRAREMDIHGLPPFFSELFLGGRVARLGLGVHRIEARQRRAVIHLVDDPGFHPLLLGPSAST